MENSMMKKFYLEWRELIMLTLLAVLFALPTPSRAGYLVQASPAQHAPLAPITISVTSTSAQGITVNPNRTGLACVNVGTANVSIAWGSNTAVVNYGVTLAPAIAFVMDDYMFTTATMNVISPTSTTLSCQEYQ